MNIRIRDVEISDAEMVWEWRNSLDARANSNNNSLIPMNDHLGWMLSRIENLPQNPFWICESSDSPIGYLRLDSTESGSKHFIVSIFVDEKFQGVGIGKKMINLAIMELRRKNEHFVLQAEVLKKNGSSLAMFKSLGFSLVLDSRDRQTLVFYSHE